MKHLAISVLLLAFVTSCNGLQRDVFPELDQPATTERGVLATTRPEIVTPFPGVATVTETTIIPTATATATKTVTEETMVETVTDVPANGFSGLYFALTADGAAQHQFQAGTDEVFALWEYRGMSPNDSIRRIWFRDDLIWLTREEDWNWGEYGSDGVIRDISVYDNEGSGLPSARYRLQLYVNDVLQEEASFVVLGL